MAELWFDDLGALQAAMTSAEWQASTDDEANFVDASRTGRSSDREREINPT